MNNLLAPVSYSNCHSVPSNSFPNIYPWYDVGKDSSAFSWSFLIQSDFSKYVVLKSEFSSNLEVLTVSGWIPSYPSRYSLIYLVFGQIPLLLYSFPLLHLNDFFKYLLY